MNLEKYKTILFGNIKTQLTKWLESEEPDTVPAEDLLRFLHSIKGTAGTLQLDGLASLAEEMMLAAEERTLPWNKKELSDFLYTLIGLSYEYEHFNALEIKTEKNRDENLPLIYIIEDDISMLMLLKDTLESHGYMVLANTDAANTAARFLEANPDCIILNVNLPGKTGFQVLDEIKEHIAFQFVPIIMLSSENNKEARIAAFNGGVDDFIAKPIELDEFIAKIDRHIKRKKLVDQFVLIDELTQVYNRRYLNNVLTQFVSDFHRTQSPFTVAMIDLDHFKEVNDSYGHLTGDRVLIEFAHFIRSNIRGSDVICRYGGEEFIILFPNTNEKGAMLKLERLLEIFRNMVFQYEDNSFSLTFSAGLYSVTHSGILPEAIIQAADEALYHAKSTGRARVESARPAQVEIPKEKMLVSIIDDDAIIRTILVKLLENTVFNQFSLDIKPFEDGLSFLNSDRLKEKGRHFLILDGIMPIMDGLEVLQKVRKSEVRGPLTVLMLTGRKSEKDISTALKLGADDYVTKPFSITELQARIERLIKRMEK
ncbi:GGDEF domain-containing response regulator [Peribacillus deserti]|uniref:Diguanylate cyclase n=1 Tax=Peribacillus deserti TaxID=673318 RepID=A0A2N5LZW2_9BACI|nr:diguanylate cyclase [Peribacillus deserti]PLT27667.1 diguanylate cyclase [Peribacillus deserti]